MKKIVIMVLISLFLFSNISFSEQNKDIFNGKPGVWVNNGSDYIPNPMYDTGEPTKPKGSFGALGMFAGAVGGGLIGFAIGGVGGAIIGASGGAELGARVGNKMD